MDSTLLKGLRVVEALARASGPRGVSELANELGLTRSNAHRTLQTLVTAGFVRPARGQPGAYECTLKLFELSSAVMSGVDVRRCAEPHMRRLAESTAETVHLSMLSESDVVYLHKIESPQPVRAYSTIGGRAPAHCVASGKALLAHLAENELPSVLDDELPRWTENTIDDPARLTKELAAVVERGFAVNRGEWRASVGGVAAIILNADGNPEAAVGVSGPIDRITSDGAWNYTEPVVAAARAISLDMGCIRYPGTEARSHG